MHLLVPLFGTIRKNKRLEEDRWSSTCTPGIRRLGGGGGTEEVLTGILKIKEGNLHPCTVLNIRRSDEATITLQISIKSIFDKLKKIIHFQPGLIQSSGFLAELNFRLIIKQLVTCPESGAARQ
jgi:hypothetical protein